jgi:GntR family transcriptional regulator
MESVCETFSVSPLIDRNETSVPLYVQISENLLDKIESGELTPGDRLPSERELSETFGVNRLTLRRAFRVLEDQGLLIRRRGSGTYVAEPKIEWRAGQLIPFTQGAQRRGYVPGADVVLFEQRPVEASIARELHLATGAAVYYVHRLRSISEEPVLLERFTMPAARFPYLELHDLTHRSLYEVMETEYGVSVSRARQSLEPVVANEYEAELLHVRPGAPLMLERRVAMDKQGQPVECGRDLYRGDRFRFVTEIAPLEL